MTLVMLSLSLAAWAAPGDRDPSFSGEDSPGALFAPHIVVDPQGRIVVAGGRFPPESLILRYDARGELDPTFGSGGMALPVSDGPGTVDVAALAVQPDGKALVAIEIAVDGRDAIRLVRLTAGGEADADFGSGGTVVIADDGYVLATKLLVQPTGAIVVAGTACAVPLDCAFWLTRLGSDGTRDASFGDAGSVTTRADGPFGIFVTDAALDRDGRITVVGRTNDPTPDATVVLARYQPDGDLDPTFGTSGRVATDFAQALFARPAVAITADDALVVASDEPSGVIRVTRFESNGAIDPAFGDGGSALVATSEPASSAADVVTAPDGRIVVTGSTGTPDVQSDWLLAALLPDGRRDRAFGVDGIVTRHDGDGEASVDEAALQPDGRVVVIGDGEIVRYLGFPRACGDADGDTRLTVTDGVQVLRAAASLPSACLPEFCDADASGTIGVRDAVQALRGAAGLAADLRCAP